MFVEMIEAYATPSDSYRAGEPYDVEDPTAADWIIKGLARVTDRQPACTRLLSRITIGAGRPCLFMPMLGEFGHLVMSHIPYVFHHQASEKIVACRDGEQVLFPNADDHVIVQDEIADKWRCGTLRGSDPLWLDLRLMYPDHFCPPVGNLTPAEELVAIRPDVRIPFAPEPHGIKADVVLGIRHREFCPEKNWAFWQRLADAIVAAGYTFAVVGARATSLKLRGQTYHSSDYYDGTDAAIELIQNCRLFVGSDTGSAHLAAAVGAPMLIFRETSPHNRDLRWRMELVNPGRVESMPETAWGDPQAVINRTLAKLEAHAVVRL